MFWIHGGSFNTGSGDYNLYGPDYLVRQGVILVTFNYRLGVLGFLSNPDWGINGNMGLQDQVTFLNNFCTNLLNIKILCGSLLSKNDQRKSFTSFIYLALNFGLDYNIHTQPFLNFGVKILTLKI